MPRAQAFDVEIIYVADQSSQTLYVVLLRPRGVAENRRRLHARLALIRLFHSQVRVRHIFFIFVHPVSRLHQA